MNPSVHVHDDLGERVFHAGDFPLEIGGDNADVRMRGVDGNLLAQLGLEGDAPYLNPGQDTVRINGMPQTQACWLKDGDVITFGDGHVVVQKRGSQIMLHARSRTARETPPPIADDEYEHPSIEPVPYHPGSGQARSTGHGTRLMQLTVLAIFALLSAAAWFMFTARSVNVIIEPEPLVLNFEGSFLTPRVGGRYLMRPGTYQVNAELDGYYPLDADIEVGRSSNQQFALQMEKLPGLYSLTSGELVGATVLIDGKEIGKTPLTDIEVPAGMHRLVVKARNHLPFEQELEIEGMHKKQQLTVELQPNWAPISFSSSPPGAIISVDDEEVGVTPLMTEMEAGNRDVVYKLSGYKPESKSLTVVAGEEMAIPTVTLAEADGILVLATKPAAANVSVDGQFRGRSPIELPVSPGKQLRVTIVKPGYETASRSITLEPDEKKELAVNLTPILGTVRIIASPVDAELLVDGQSRGTADQVLSLTARPHQIEVRKTGYASHLETFTPQRGLEQRLTIVLQTVADAAAAELPSTVSTVAGQLRLIRGGSLRLGSPRREQGRRSNEILRDVELTREFYIGETEVSNAAFREFAPTHSSRFFGGISLDGDTQPAVRVSWQQAARFCNWLSDRDGLPRAYVDRDGRLVAKRPMNIGYRLPSEAEWVWVSRFAGSAQSRKFVWGDELPPPKGAGNFADNAVGSLVGERLANYDDGHSVSAPIGSFAPNSLGLQDLAGNVAEWNHDYYELAVVDPYLSLIDPLGPEFGDQHVIRGASWMTGRISELRSAYRDHGAQGRPDLGFRIARYAR